MIITIPIKPKAVQSTRFSGKRAYADPEVTKWKTDALWHIKTQLNKPILKQDGPVGLVIEYSFGLTKCVTKAVKDIIAARLPVFKTSRPDVDNLTKGIKDILSGIAYNDDSQVVFAVLTKVYTVKNYIKIRIITDDNELNALYKVFFGDCHG